MRNEPSHLTAALAGSVALTLLALVAGCDDTGSSPSSGPQSEGLPTRATARQNLEISHGETDTFSVQRELDPIGAFQADKSGVKLETTGSIGMHPGYKVVVDPDPNQTENFEFSIFGQPDFDVTWKIVASGSASSIQLERTVGLCGSNKSCPATFDIDGRTYQIEPRATLALTASDLDQGSLSIRLEDNPLRHYLRAATRFERGAGWTSSQQHDFEVVAEAADASSGFAGSLQIDLRLEFVLLRQGGNGTALARVEWMRLSNLLDTSVSPPDCFAKHDVELGAAVTYSNRNSDVLCASSGSNCLTEKQLFSQKILSTQHSMKGLVSGCEQGAKRCTSRSDCPGANEVCRHGFCIESTPIRATLEWREEIDLDLIVRDDDGYRLKPLSGNRPGDVDGWMPVTSDGSTGGSSARNVEIAVVRSVRANESLEFQVEAQEPLGSNENGTKYDLSVYHESKFADQPDSIRRLSGRLFGRPRSVTHELRNDNFVNPQ